MGFELLTTLVVIGTDCTGSWTCQSWTTIRSCPRQPQKILWTESLSGDSQQYHQYQQNKQQPLTSNHWTQKRPWNMAWKYRPLLQNCGIVSIEKLWTVTGSISTVYDINYTLLSILSPQDSTWCYVYTKNKDNTNFID